jgi:hypothetical protein
VAVAAAELGPVAEPVRVAAAKADPPTEPTPGALAVLTREPNGARP